MTGPKGNTNARTHGMSRTPEYQSWNRMRNRCTDPNDASFHRYGGRGIAVCAAWVASFEAFFADVGLRPGVGYSLERVNNEGNYEPGNCVWADAKRQARNRSNNRPVTHDGSTRTLAEWAEQTGIPPHTIRMRLEREWSVGDALARPVRARSQRASS